MMASAYVATPGARAVTTRRVEGAGALLLNTLLQQLGVSRVNRYLVLTRSGRFFEETECGRSVRLAPPPNSVV